MAREDYKLIATYAGKYGHYEIREDAGIFSASYYIYKNMESWKSASSVNGAVEIIRNYDSSATSVG